MKRFPSEAQSALATVTKVWLKVGVVCLLLMGCSQKSSAQQSSVSPTGIEASSLDTLAGNSPNAPAKDRGGEEVQDLSAVKIHYYKVGYQDLCNEILERRKNDTLKDIQVGSPAENYQKSFFADIDNDGENEELQYGNRYIWEIIKGERKSPFHPYGRDAFYSGTYIISLNDNFFALFMSRGPLEVQHFTEITEEEARKEIPPEMRKTTFNTSRYKVDLVCKYYED